MDTLLIFLIFAGYSFLLLLVGYITSRKADNTTFFNAGRSSPWFVVSYGMIGASLSGITFISVPGNVLHTQFSYLVMVFGYLAGYILIATILLPLYYRLNLISIYAYLRERFGYYAHKTGATFFLLSRIIGASLRMYIVVSILQYLIFEHWGIPFWITVLFFVMLIWAYTFKGGIKTVVWTDTLQTTFMLASVVLTVYVISRSLNMSVFDLWEKISEAGYTKTFYLTEWQDPKYYLKMFLGGMFIALAMTGLDQDMMQKNLTCRNLKDARKNVITLGIILIPINFLFLFLGAVLYYYAEQYHLELPQDTDKIFSTVVFHLGMVPGAVFLVGLIAAAYSSADSALTSLTTSFSLDILEIDRMPAGKAKKEKIRKAVHIAVSLLIVMLILVLHTYKDDAIITILFKLAGYTYGPLLGLYSFGLFTKRKVPDKVIPWLAVASPLLTWYVNAHSQEWFWNYEFGFELLILNAAIMFAGLFIFSKKQGEG